MIPLSILDLVPVVAGATPRDALRNSEFRGLVVAQVASEWGDNIARVALASLVLTRTDSAFLAVLAFVVSFVPAVFGSALLGTAADRLPRKVVLIACDLLSAAGADLGRSSVDHGNLALCSTSFQSRARCGSRATSCK